MTLTTSAGTNQYGFQLAHAAGDTLLFTDEWFNYTPLGRSDRRPRHMGAGHREAQLIVSRGNDAAGHPGHAAADHRPSIPQYIADGPDP